MINIFISHAHEDKKLASLFGEVLKECSMGLIRTFWSSDLEFGSGIQYGDEWFNTIINKIEESDYVIALLTKNSYKKPWILFESGYAKSYKNKKVLGILLGLEFSELSGPFTLFQNCDDKKESIKKLIIEVLTKIENLSPNLDLISNSITSFLKKAKPLYDKPSHIKVDIPCKGVLYAKILSLSKKHFTRRFIPRLNKEIKIYDEYSLYSVVYHQKDIYSANPYINGSGVVDMNIINPWQPEQEYAFNKQKEIENFITQRVNFHENLAIINYKYYNGLQKDSESISFDFNCNRLIMTFVLDFTPIVDFAKILTSKPKCFLLKNNEIIRELPVDDSIWGIFTSPNVEMYKGYTIRMNFDLIPDR